MGGIYGAMGNFSKAIDCYIQSLKILEDLKDKKGLTGVLDNIGTLYFYQGNYPVAIDYENRSIKLAKEINDKEDLQYALNNIALIYQIQKDFDTAIALYKQSLKISEEADNKTLMLTTLDNIGNTYYSKGDTTLALGYYNKCLKSAEEINDKSAVAGVLNNIGNVYKDARNYKRSIEYSTKALSLANETGEAAQIREASNSLYLSYKNTGEYTKALAMHELYTSTVDSITSSESKKEIVRQEFKYEYEKKTAADSVRTIEKNKLIAIQFKEAETQRYALYGGVLLLFIFGGFMFNRYRITQKQKSIIELQKNLVEEKQREILDSIYYARRIQRSLLPTEKYIHKNLKRLNVK
ncbi:MAG: tetratricopeptide repeat protein [Bacteroidia bacterium]